MGLSDWEETCKLGVTDTRDGLRTPEYIGTAATGTGCCTLAGTESKEIILKIFEVLYLEKALVLVLFQLVLLFLYWWHWVAESETAWVKVNLSISLGGAR